MSNTKYQVTLHTGLSDDDKKKAYNIMGYVLMDYKREHLVSKEISDKLNQAHLIEYSKPVPVMY